MTDKQAEQLIEVIRSTGADLKYALMFINMALLATCGASL